MECVSVFAQDYKQQDGEEDRYSKQKKKKKKKKAERAEHINALLGSYGSLMLASLPLDWKSSYRALLIYFSPSYYILLLEDKARFSICT